MDPSRLADVMLEKRSWPLYRLGHWVVGAALWLLGRWEVHGLENVPNDGPVILAPNHTSYLDPPAVGTAMRRPIWFMAKSELFENLILGPLIWRMRAFPVRRGRPDRRALRNCLRLLEAGEVVTVFPEGERSKTGQLQEPELGVAVLALRSGAPVVPVAMSGTDEVLPRHAVLPRFGKVVVRFGEPMTFPEYRGKKASKDDLREVADRIMREIARLLREPIQP
ncbi:MAG: lysophospholipid acyltransferase family protein [Armatimonadota bacterium]